MKNYRKQKYLNVDADNFIKLSSPEHIYLLGFIWADGNIIKKRKSIRVEILNSDMDNLLNIFEVTGQWSYSYRQRLNRNKQAIAECNNAKLVDFLILNDYDKKSEVSPNKIFNLISEELIKYFIRGWVDGDGCFYSNKTSSQFTISGSYEQDWDALSSLLDNKNITHKISRIITPKNHKYSYLRITKKYDIIKFGQFIYCNNNFGLIRKYEKYKVIENKCQI